MKAPGTFLKILTVLSSVLLVAGFISYRAGAFAWLREAEPVAEPGEVRSPAEPPAPKDATNKSDTVYVSPAEDSEFYMSGSKSLSFRSIPPTLKKAGPGQSPDKKSPN
jgi:hypothetical protein